MTLLAHVRTIGIVVLLTGLCWSGPTLQGQTKSKQKQTAPTVDEAKAFIASAEKRILDLWVKAQRAQWVQSNFITDDTEQMAADAQREVVSATLALAADATRFDGIKLPADMKRKLMLLRLSLTLPAPQSPADQAELTRIAVSLESDYGKGVYCPDGKEGKCYDLNEMSRILATSRDPEELQKMWTGWRTIAPPMRDRFTRLVSLANKGARDLGFADLGAMWRSNYDMSPREFNTEMERLWQQVKPLYDALHAYVRWKLAEHYGTDVVPEDGLIPAHLLGNMWSQQWDNIYPLVAPENDQQPYDLTAILKEKDLGAITTARYGERFFVSLGFDPLPETFWKRSLFMKPADRDVVCHASAWDIDFEKDIRIKMCIEPTEEDFNTIHHELGHNFYQRAYMNQPPLYRDGANDGFHEAIGDMVALSITPDYLHKIGLLEEVPESEGDISFLLKKALEKVAFLPFGYVMDQWRWKVFSGEIKPADYTKAWWQLVEKYQGIKSPVERTEKDFDPGAKYHIPASVPYARYFLAAILQFQFHRGMLHEIGYTGPVHQGSIYGSTKAGEKLKAMLAMGRSRPWPEALETITGEKKFDASAMLEYFAPLKKWLDEQNQGKKVGF
jgi:peptidyl-dipeptidase A